MAFQLDKERKIVAGVAAGLAKDLDIDPIIPRLGFVFLTLWVGGGIALYIILWILMAMNSNNKLNINKE